MIRPGVTQRVTKAAAIAVAHGLALLACTTASAQNETLYVIEQLVVGVSATADGSGDRVTQIKSGDRVEVIEREGDQSHVKLASGEEGWVRTSYLSPAPPLREQLKARTDELEKLRQDKTKLEADLASARKAAAAAANVSTGATVGASANSSIGNSSINGSSSAVSSGAAGAPAASDVADGSATAGSADANSADSARRDLPPSNPSLFSEEGILPARPTWIVALIAAIVALVVGFVLGWRVLDQRIRAKYGGLRIY